MEKGSHHRVICFGEVLWDILPAGPAAGGAPMNVTYHLHKLGKNPALITRIGNDEKGRELRELFNDDGICTDHFQVDNKYKTGVVYANPNEHNEMTYDIVKPVAWDFIEWNNNYRDLLTRAEYFVFGSLAAREKTSRTTLFRLLEHAKNRVLDINLRAPHYDTQIVEELLSKTDILKLNLAELEQITGWFSDQKTVEERIVSLALRFNIKNVVVTMGADGAILFTNDQLHHCSGIPVNVADTVGSGDAFLAGLLSSLMDNRSPADALQFANTMGAFVASRRGGCPQYELNEITEMNQVL